MRVIDPVVGEEKLPLLVTPQAVVADSGGQLKAGDPRLDVACDAASAAVRRYCRWHVAPVIEETITVDGSGGSVLRLPSQHVVDVLEVKVSGVPVSADQFSWSVAGLLELHGKRFPKRYRSVEVTLRHGYDYVPDLSAIASQVARFALASPMGRTREQAGQISVSWGTAQGMAWSESMLEMMKPYRLQIMP
ncbi:hypothetical protein FYJ24_06865 [Actinomycetaceae bacterium WB03_NA08]|uniref:Uncharacterized protein n=1 Tax=Scrofimicrobium canadense TaxID=2652290 RepID=A0A6N7W8M4_9ACTO|nr:hypothetical protein [Scrofimicrobium canadense]MSS84488.1 hypothetical protein [Scrofimicrobium canadense]